MSWKQQASAQYRKTMMSKEHSSANHDRLKANDQKDSWCDLIQRSMVITVA